MKKKKRKYCRRTTKPTLGGRKLLKWRNDMGFTARQMAIHLNACESTILGWENGYCLPRPAKMKSMEQFCIAKVNDWFKA